MTALQVNERGRKWTQVFESSLLAEFLQEVKTQNGVRKIFTDLCSAFREIELDISIYIFLPFKGPMWRKKIHFTNVS